MATARVTLTIPSDILVQWRRLARLERESLSSLISEALGALTPGIVQIADAAENLRRLKVDQRASLEAQSRAMTNLLALEADLEEICEEGYDLLAEALEPLDPHVSNRGVNSDSAS